MQKTRQEVLTILNDVGFDIDNFKNLPILKVGAPLPLLKKTVVDCSALLPLFVIQMNIELRGGMDEKFIDGPIFQLSYRYEHCNGGSNGVTISIRWDDEAKIFNIF